MTHASQLGFFLSPARFRHRLTPNPTSNALMAAIYLWGSKLSSSSTLRSREPAFADRATQAAVALQATSPAATGLLYTIQAEVLLANYFFSHGRLLEGRYHALAAVALVTGSQLHQLDPRVLSAGGDTVTAGERVRAFWTVASLDKVWSVAMNTPACMSQNGRASIHISTPWPLSPEAYEQVSCARCVCCDPRRVLTVFFYPPS